MSFGIEDQKKTKKRSIVFINQTFFFFHIF